MSIEKFEDIEVYPVGASALGINAHYILGCKEVGRNAPYASCLKHIKDRSMGRLDAQYADCSAAIGRKDCPALKMQKEEQLENKAIYFVNRKKLQAFNQYRDEMAAQQIQYPESRRKANKSKPVEQEIEQAKASTPFVAEDSYAAAINRAIQDEERKVIEAQSVLKAELPSPPKVAMASVGKSGMSLIEMARAKRALAV